jgi:hypothetical protein
MPRLLWTQRQDTGPSPRFYTGMVYDDAIHRTVLVGSFVQDVDTWLWDGERWVQVADTGPQQVGYAITYHRQRKRVVACHAGTWEFDGTDWTQISRDERSGPMAFDTKRQRPVAVTTPQEVQPLRTSELNGTNWTQVADAGPSWRTSFSVAYDEERAKLVLFGGNLVDGIFRPGGDTWGWDGQVWQQLSDIGPSPRYGAAMAYDSARKRVVLFGGLANEGGASALKGDTWTWDGALWEQLEDMGPSPRQGAAMAYDRDRDRMVLFGGTTFKPGGDCRDTWELGPYA